MRMATLLPGTRQKELLMRPHDSVVDCCAPRYHNTDSERRISGTAEIDA